MGMRDLLNKSPLLGWVVAAVVAILAVVLLVRGMGGGETAELTQEITIRCSETGKEWKMVRGAMERELMLRPFPVKPEEGLINPDTGRPTGFPVDDWKLTVERVNSSRDPSTTAAAPAKPESGNK